MNNQGSALAEVISLEAWHDEFTDSVRAVDLYVDVVFSAGQLGSEQEAEVRFDLRIRRAEVVVVVPATEPLAIDPASVSRDSPSVAGKRTTSRKRHRSWSFGLGAKGTLGKGPSASALAKVAAGAKGSSSEELEHSETLRAMAVRNSRTEDSHHRWTITPAILDFLDGRPWNANAEPRLKLVDTRSKPIGISPSVRVEVRCRRDDLVISNIVIKDKARHENVRKRSGYRNREIAAEAYIRDQLLRSGLVIGDLRDASAQMTLSVTFAETRPKY